MGSVLVTGAAGFIGSHLVGRLCEDGHAVRALDNLSTGDRANLAPWADRIDFMEADVCDAEAVAAAVRGVDWVFHLAAHVSVPESVERPRRTFDVNVGGAAQVAYAAAAAGASRLLFASSCAVYGETGPDPVGEDTRPRPLSPYGASKRMAECLLGELLRSGRLPALSFRFFNVYGPRQRADSPYSGVVARFLDRARGGQPLVIHGDGLQTRDFVAVQDVVALLARAAERDPARWPDVVNVGTGAACTIRGLADLVNGCAPDPQPVQSEPERAGDLRHSRADTARVRATMDWAATVSLADGIPELWAAQASAGA